VKPAAPARIVLHDSAVKFLHESRGVSVETTPPQRTVCATRISRASVLVITLLLTLLLGCSTKRDDAHTPDFRHDVAPLLDAKCASCHQGSAPAGGFRVTSYLETIGCVGEDGVPATRASDAPILRVLDRPSHALLLNAAERDLLARWVAAGAPAFARGVHEPSFVDPRSPASHARFLRTRGWKPMLDAHDPDACATCHEGTPTPPAAPRTPAPGATSCQTCHTEPAGALGCSTCHGDGHTVAYPPPDRCFFPDARAPGAHATHVQPSTAKTSGLPCATCHPTPADADPRLFGGVHGDGHVQVWLRDGATAYDASTGRCASACHGGPDAARPTPAWSETTKMTCNDCHGAPPKPHLAGACNGCHREANENGTALGATTLHLDGTIELGDGKGTCGSCHGTGEDPWPTTGAHAAHASPSAAAKVECSTCHTLPYGVPHPLGKGAATVSLTGLAAKGGLAPTYDAATKTCADVYCHALPGATTPKPQWTDPTASKCGGCHGLPPSAPHSTAVTCGSTSCHAGAIESGTLTTAGKAHHVDGKIDLSLP
jgi:predicted CxxxxCH...CXXCH cytochrome family protein